MNENLKYFLNKVCTVIVRDVNYRFKVEQMNDYFVGIIENIDDQGIMMHHMITKCKQYILFPHIVSITEEQIVPESDPEYTKVIEQYRKDKPTTSAKNTVTMETKNQSESPFINPTAMAEVAKRMKESIRTI